MKKFFTNIALALLAVLVMAIGLYVLFYIVLAAGLLLLSHIVVWHVARLYGRWLRWKDDRAHQAFIDDVIRTARRSRPASANIIID